MIFCVFGSQIPLTTRLTDTLQWGQPHIYTLVNVTAERENPQQKNRIIDTEWKLWFSATQRNNSQLRKNWITGHFLFLFLFLWCDGQWTTWKKGKWIRAKSGGIKERGLRLAVVDSPPCNMSNDSNGVGGLQSPWNFTGKWEAPFILWTHTVLNIGFDHVQLIQSILSEGQCVNYNPWV